MKKLLSIFCALFLVLAISASGEAATREEILAKYKDAPGVGDFKIGMTIGEIMVLDKGNDIDVKRKRKTKIYPLVDRSYSAEFSFYSGMPGNQRYMLYLSDAKEIVMMSVRIDNLQIKPTFEYIKKNHKIIAERYNDEARGDIIIGIDTNRNVIYKVEGPYVRIFRKEIYDSAMKIVDKKRQEDEVKKSKSAIN